MAEIIIRSATEADFGSIIKLNQAEVIQTSPMDLDRLSLLSCMAVYHKVAVLGNEIAAFLIAMRDGASYQNENYGWFSSRYSKFLYVDRIIVGTQFSGLKIGSRMYRDLFDYTRSLGIEMIMCEYNIKPPNPASKRFHDKFGFKEVGTQYVANGTKMVSLQAAMT